MIDLAAIDIEIFGNPASRWMVAGAAALAAFVVLALARAAVTRRTRAEAEADPASWQATTRAIAGRVSVLFMLVVALDAGALMLQLPEEHVVLLATVLSVAVLLQAALIGDELVKIYAERHGRVTEAAESEISNAIALIRFFARAAIWSLAALMILGNLGIDVTALVAGLGIGGIAIALAAQNILGDLFASLSIVLDKPFVVGDFIIFGDDMGTVERIGVKTTRLKSLSGEQLVVPNNDLLSTRVRNMRRMRERRVVFRVGIVYETPHEKLARVAGLLREIVESEARVRFDRAHFASFGDFSLNFEVVYYVLGRDYNEYMDIQQSINLKVFKTFEDEGLEFAYPTRTVIVASPEDVAAAAGG